MKPWVNKHACIPGWWPHLVGLWLTIGLATGFGNRLMPLKPKPPVYVLIHGGFHGAWCWQKLRPTLENHGQVITPDLAGSGKEQAHFVKQVGDWLSRQAQPVILVGHSSGGMVITELANRYPQKIRALVYLAAFLLPPGQSPPQIIAQDTASLLPKALQIDSITHRVKVNPIQAKRVFYGDCADSIANWAIAQLTTEPQVPRSSLPTGQAVAHRRMATQYPPRFYIETRQDCALGVAAQRRMYQRLPCRKVYSLPTSHSPFLSQPRKLAAILVAIHKQVQ